MSPVKSNALTDAQRTILETNALSLLPSATHRFKAELGYLPYIWCVRQLRDNVPMKDCRYRSRSILACNRCQHVIHTGDLFDDEDKRALLPGLAAKIDEELNRCIEYDKKAPLWVDDWGKRESNAS